MTFDKDFGSTLSANITGEGVGQNYSGVMKIGETKSNFEALKGLCTKHEVTRQEDTMRYKFSFESIKQFNSFSLTLDNMSEFDGEEGAPQNAYWADENILVFTKSFFHKETSSDGPLGFLSERVEKLRGESSVQLKMNFEYKIDSVVVILPESGVEHFVDSNKKSFTINTDYKTIWADEEFELLSFAVFFKKGVRP